MKRHSITFAILATLAACAPPSAETQFIYSLSKETQYAAFARCGNELGVMPVLHTLDFNDGGVSITALNQNGVTLAEARSMNICAREKLLENFSS